MDKDVVKRPIYINLEIWQKVKAQAALENKPLYVYVREALESKLKEK